ncbi:MAG: translation initiation factor IF-2, partial [Holosporaceae bacterium]|nr:translation initiation factor IF-2 [Holosporaceae bacterium]
MVEQKKGTLSLSRHSTLKTPDIHDGRIRQSFSHGKSKVVAVEVKKKRSLIKPQTTANSSVDIYKNSNLTSSELETRLKVVKEAVKDKKEQKIVHQKEENKPTSVNEDILDTPIVPEIAEEKLVVEKVNKNAESIRESDNRRNVYSRTFKQSKSFDSGDDDDLSVNTVKSSRKILPVKRDIKELKGRYEDYAGKVSIYNALNDEQIKMRSLSSIKRARQKHKFIQQNTDEVKIIKEVILPETISVQELSNRMAIRTGEVIKALMKLGVMATANQIIDADTAEVVVLELGHKVKRVSDSDVEIGLKKDDTIESLLPRPPVVTIMGHVDHGKTSLLDALRKTDVALKEAGGITQAIGAYQVTIKDGRKITFIDTPGHAAFTEMRSRGANITDIVVLVVAADDSVKDQTIEAINHAKAAEAPIVLAINKIDKQGADPNRVRKDLLNYGIVVEAYGGEVIDVEISAKTGANLEKLEESILLQAEVLDLKANPNRTAEGIVIESKIEKGLGPVATVLIKKGTLKTGDIFVSGIVYGRARAIRTDRRENLSELTPGMPGEIIGFNGPAVPG